MQNMSNFNHINASRAIARATKLVDIVLKSKDFGGTLSLIGNYIIELSCLCCQVLSFRCTFGQRVRFMSKLSRPHLFLEMQASSRNQ